MTEGYCCLGLVIDRRRSDGMLCVPNYQMGGAPHPATGGELDDPVACLPERDGRSSVPSRRPHRSYLSVEKNSPRGRQCRAVYSFRENLTNYKFSLSAK